MGNKEWQQLCRDTKNDGTFHELMTAIRHYIKTYPTSWANEEAFISFFSYNAIKNWYHSEFRLIRLGYR